MSNFPTVANNHVMNNLNEMAYFNMLNAKVGSQFVPCMVDSGASVSVLSKSIFSLLNSKCYTVVTPTVTAVCGVVNKKTANFSSN